MKRFIVKVLVWSAVFLVILCVVDSIIYYTDFVRKNKNKTGHEVAIALYNSKTKSAAKYVILGDSVGLQLYSSWESSNDIVSLATNRGVSLAGQYFLLNNYVQTNQDSLPEYVYIIMTYQSLRQDLCSDLSYPYFLKFFYNKQYIPLYEDALWTQVRKTPFYWTARLPFFRTSSFAFHYEITPNGNYSLVSPITKVYLDKIEQLTEENGLNCSFVFAPIRESLRSAFSSSYTEAMPKGEISSQLLIDGFNTIKYLPDSLYRDDVHFNDSDVPADYLGIKPR